MICSGHCEVIITVGDTVMFSRPRHETAPEEDPWSSTLFTLHGVGPWFLTMKDLARQMRGRLVL